MIFFRGQLKYQKLKTKGRGQSLTAEILWHGAIRCILENCSPLMFPGVTFLSHDHEDVVFVVGVL